MRNAIAGLLVGALIAIPVTADAASKNEYPAKLPVNCAHASKDSLRLMRIAKKNHALAGTGLRFKRSHGNVCIVANVK